MYTAFDTFIFARAKIKVSNAVYIMKIYAINVFINNYNYNLIIIEFMIS